MHGSRVLQKGEILRAPTAATGTLPGRPVPCHTLATPAHGAPAHGLVLTPRAPRHLTRSDQLSKLAAHVEIASKLNGRIDGDALAQLGKLEQDLVYGDATSKEVIAFLTANQAIPATDKVGRGAARGGGQLA